MLHLKVIFRILPFDAGGTSVFSASSTASTDDDAGAEPKERRRRGGAPT